jgi:putative ABC transport system permease protein
MPMGNVREYIAGSDVFSYIGLVHSVNLYAEQGGRVEYVAAQYISADLFDMMRVVPMAGRTFRAEEDSEAVGEVVILTHAYWQTKFGGQDVIGNTIPLRRALADRDDWPEFEYEIIGVLPPDFTVPSARRASGYGVPGPPVSERFWTEPDVILPLGLDWAHGPRYAQRFYMFAQLRDGVTPEQARQNLQPIADGMGESDPRLRGREVALVPVEQVLLKEYGTALGFLGAATALMLFVACASVSSLLLGWGVAREQELAVRAALGAGARRIFSQLLTEATAIALAAGVLGVPLAYLGMGCGQALRACGRVQARRGRARRFRAWVRPRCLTHDRIACWSLAGF